VEAFNMWALGTFQVLSIAQTPRGMTNLLTKVRALLSEEKTALMSLDIILPKKKGRGVLDLVTVLKKRK
jgi:response regulator of citrate/malate metabolism